MVHGSIVYVNCKINSIINEFIIVNFNSNAHTFFYELAQKSRHLAVCCIALHVFKYSIEFSPPFPLRSPN